MSTQRKHISRNEDCRICKTTKLTKIFNFGPTPLANSFLKKGELQKKEPFYPLDVYFCRNCGLVQLRDIISPEILFKNYVYVSSTSPVFIAHFQKFAQKAVKRFKLSKQSLVVDVGSNDGILLKPFKEKGVRVLGIEPAKNIATLANKEGIPTLPEFFSVTLAKKILKQYGPAKVVTATNVFAHINDLGSVVMGVKHLLTSDGVFIIEAPYLVDFLEKNLFDTVYHEHLSYFALSPLVRLFDRFAMRIFDVERVDSHGGSIRVFVTSSKVIHPNTTRVNQLLKLEKRLKLRRLLTYKRFSQTVNDNKISLRKLLLKLKKQGYTIAGYGAPAKGNTLLNYFKIGHDIIDFIVDDNQFKQGLLTPGTHIPVVSPNKLKSQPPEYLLILAWNFAPSIMKRCAEFHKLGGKFIVPVPTPKVI